MPSRCSVPLCKGNYPTGPKVTVFSFPRNEDLLKEWLQVIQRKKVSKYSRVCELHFKKEDILETTSAFDPKTGRVISASLKVKRLADGAIPSIFQGYPRSNQTSPKQRRVPPDVKKVIRENSLLKKSLQEEQDRYNKGLLNSLEDVLRLLKESQICDEWNIHQKEGESLTYFKISCDVAPIVEYSVKISVNLDVSVFSKNVELKKLGKLSFPCQIKHINELLPIFENLSKFSKESKDVSNEDNASRYVIDVIIDLLQSLVTHDNENCIKFMQEQLQLLLVPKNHCKYSSDSLGFASLLHTISPHAYKVLRQSGKLMVPHPKTLKRSCDNIVVSPDIPELESDDDIF